MNQSDYEIIVEDDIAIIKVQDLLSEFATQELLDTVSKKMLDHKQYDYVVDLSAIDYMNSVGLNLLLILKSRAALVGGRVAFANPSKKVIQLLEMTKLKDILQPASSVSEAVASLKE